MSTSLEDALNDVDLEAGKTYSCRVKGLPVRVHVGTAPDADGPAELESDTMLDPWTDLPRSSPVRIVKARIVARRLPDPPEFPSDEGAS